MIPAASEEDLRSLPPAVQRKVRAVFLSCYLPIGCHFFVVPNYLGLLAISFPLAGGGVQRIVDSRFDSVELGTLAGRYEALLCSELPPPSIIPTFFFCFPLFFQPGLHLGNPAHPSPSTTSSDVAVSFYLQRAMVQQAGLPMVAGSPFSTGGAAQPAMAHHITNLGMMGVRGWISPPEPLGWRPPFKPHHPRYQLMAPKPTGPP